MSISDKNQRLNNDTEDFKINQILIEKELVDLQK